MHGSPYNVNIKSLQRLRNGEKIAGYRREEAGRSYYSKDLFWWNGTAIAYEKADACIGRYDNRQRPLFVNDIIKVKHGGIFPRTQHYSIIEKTGSPELVHLQTGLSFGLDILKKVKHVQFVSYTFLNPGSGPKS